MNKFIKLSKIGTLHKSDFISDAPIQSMHHLLVSLFVDRTKMKTLQSFFDDEIMNKWIVYNDCLSMNDASTIEFETKNNMVDEYDENHNVFIPND